MGRLMISSVTVSHNTGSDARDSNTLPVENFKQHEPAMPPNHVSDVAVMPPDSVPPGRGIASVTVDRMGRQPGATGGFRTVIPSDGRVVTVMALKN